MFLNKLQSIAKLNPIELKTSSECNSFLHTTWKKINSNSKNHKNWTEKFRMGGFFPGGFFPWGIFSGGFFPGTDKTTPPNTVFKFSSSFQFFSSISFVKSKTLLSSFICKSGHSKLTLQSVNPKLLEITWILYVVNLILNPFIPNAPFSYPLKPSEN